MESMGVKVDDGYLHHFRFADNTEHRARGQSRDGLAEFDIACKKIGLPLNLTKTMFMRSGSLPDVSSTTNGTNISEALAMCNYVGRKVNMMNDLTRELIRRKRATWETFKNVEGVVKKTKNIRPRAHFFDTAVFTALTYASKIWTLRKQDEHAVSVIQRAMERTMSGILCTRKCRRGSGAPNPVDERKSGMPLITARNGKSDERDTSCDIVMTVGQVRLRTGSFGMSNEHHEGSQHDDQTSSGRRECYAPRPSSVYDSKSLEARAWIKT
ncbi:hypothetical protein V3C99_007745 [Haemonchus contortus]|uniref:Reverse transcriptase domain-containing protein n=1 Tax=Haemonchus contortus TaxID=6289 RepID=A0A7I5EB90_HAECO